MEMYAKGSSFETNLTLQTRNSFRDVSFSSYLNKAEENMIRKLTNQADSITNDHHYRKKSDEDDEIGVFGAEKYFKGEIEDGDSKTDIRSIDTSDSSSKTHQENERFEEFDHGVAVKLSLDQTNIHTSSVRSNVSWNSRSGLLPRSKQPPGKTEKGSKTKSFLANFACNCINKKSTQISEKRFIIPAKQISNPRTKLIDLNNNFAEKNTRNDYFSFPVLDSNDPNSNSNLKSGNLAGKLVEEDKNGGVRLSLGRKLSLLNHWDVDVQTEEDEVYIPSSGMYNNDAGSDSSSDLFEIESFSTNGNSSFLAHGTSESNCYAPSEVSIEWSVVTASAADFSVVSDFEEVRGGGGWGNSSDEQKKRVGILSGCTSHKAVRVAGDEYKVGVGGRRRRMSEIMAVGGMIRGGNGLGRFDPTRGIYGSDVCPMTEPKGRHASQLLYIQQ